MSNQRVAAALLASVCLFTGSLFAAERPNVLFVVCDDLNTHVAPSGYSPIDTPAFDRLAAAGMTFRRAYCQYPVCGPSRASFLSGLYPQSTGVLDNRADIRETQPDAVSMPQCFQEAGYWTAAVGKVFHVEKLDHGEVAWNEFPGWFKNDEMPIERRARQEFVAVHGPINNARTRAAWRAHYPTIAPQTRNQNVGYGPSGLRDDQHKDGKNARQVAAWLDSQAQGDKPFFIACGIQKPHVPFLAPDKYFDRYPREDLVLELTPAAFWDQAPKTALSNRFEGFGFELGVENESLRREYTQAYHACISFIDAQIGRVLDAVKRNGHWEDTVIVLTSDHGYHLGDHFMWGKVTLFEECARVPLIVRIPEAGFGPRAPSGSQSHGLVELVDLFPTLADLCDIEPPANLQGSSLAPLLADPQRSGKEVAYTVVTRGAKLGKAIRTSRWRYAQWPDGEELYDLENDPQEFTNLAADSGVTEVMRSMRTLLATAADRAAAERN